MIPSILLFVAASLNVILGFFGFLKQPKKFFHIIFLLFSLSAAGWIFSIFVLLNFSQSLLWGELPFLFTALSLCFLAIFSCQLGIYKIKHKFYSLFFLIPTAIISWFIFSDQIIRSAVLIDGSIVNTFGPFYYLFVVYIIAYVAIAIGILLYKYKTSYGNELMRVKFIFLGIWMVIMPSIFTNLLLPTFFNIWQYNILGPSFTLFMVISISYAMARYHLMDVWFVLRLGAIFTSLLTIISFVYVGFNYLLVHYLNMAEPWNFLVPSLVITLGFSPLKHLIERITDKVFFKKNYVVSDLIGSIDDSIHDAGLDLEKSISESNQLIAGALKVEWAGILILTSNSDKDYVLRHYIGNQPNFESLNCNHCLVSYLNRHKNRLVDREFLERSFHQGENYGLFHEEILKEMIDLNIFMAMPIDFRDNLLGFYLLGRKKSQDPFSAQDMKLLRHASREMSFAIDNASSYEELQKLDAAKSEFVSVISHQLRTPITISRCNLELSLTAKIDQKDKKEAIMAAYSGVTFLGKQLDQLLTSLDIEENKIVVNKQNFDVVEMVNTILKKLKPNFKNKKLKFNVDLDKNNKMVWGDNLKLHQVLNTVIENALTYANRETEIIIKTEIRKINRKNYFVFTATDYGLEIKKPEAPEIFKKFYRSAEARMLSPNGFGLGLYIAKKLINFHGGELWFEKAPDNGVTFIFSLPLEK
jgi:signal transduction histidine kinase